MFDVNRASVAKLGWQILSKKDCLWVKAMSTKYLAHRNLLNVEGNLDSTWFWKGILRTRDLLAKGICWAVKKGDKNKIWCDPYPSNMPNFRPLIKQGAVLSRSVDRVQDLAYPDGLGWKRVLIINSFDDSTVANILSLPPHFGEW